jgi:hypothetical protein
MSRFRIIDQEPVGGKLAFGLLRKRSSGEDAKGTAKQAGIGRQCIGECAAVVARNLESDNPDVQSNE